MKAGRSNSCAPLFENKDHRQSDIHLYNTLLDSSIFIKIYQLMYVIQMNVRSAGLYIKKGAG